MAVNAKVMDAVHEKAWRGFKPGPWQTRISIIGDYRRAALYAKKV